MYCVKTPDGALVPSSVRQDRDTCVETFVLRQERAGLIKGHPSWRGDDYFRRVFALCRDCGFSVVPVCVEQKRDGHFSWPEIHELPWQPGLPFPEANRRK